jgi:hypothetical protein
MASNTIIAAIAVIVIVIVAMAAYLAYTGGAALPVGHGMSRVAVQMTDPPNVPPGTEQLLVA